MGGVGGILFYENFILFSNKKFYLKLNGTKTKNVLFNSVINNTPN